VRFRGERQDLEEMLGKLTRAPDFRLFPLFCALFFPLFSIVLAPAAFLSPPQGLAL
jgi:hypothetical protein